MKQDEMKIEVKPLSFLKPAEYNPRKDLQPGDPEWEKIENSITTFGYVQPILINSDGTIISGHQRFKIMQHLGYKEVQCVVVDVDKETEKAMNVAMNKIDGDWDIEKLGELIGEIDASPLKMLTGFSEDEIDELEKKVGKINTDWFETRQKNDTSRQEGNQEYNDFLDKFEIAKTTDDCYTPDNIYEVVCEWVEKEYGLNRKNFVRPFYPNGDYQAENYKKTDIVVDNPPFSILAEIIKFYQSNGIKFFLFAPGLTVFSSSSSSCCCICCGVTVTYENGAGVCTSFVTNLDEETQARTAPTLTAAIKEENDKNLAQRRKKLRKYSYPDFVVSASMLNYISLHGIEFKLTKENAHFIRGLDEQKESETGIFGSGFLISEKAAAEKAAAEKAAAEKAAAEKAAAEKWSLSEREWEIIKGLGGD